jgi:hypothetical protein
LVLVHRISPTSLLIFNPAWFFGAQWTSPGPGQYTVWVKTADFERSSGVGSGARRFRIPIRAATFIRQESQAPGGFDRSANIGKEM